MSFAKLYGSDDEQILVMLDSGDEGPEIRFYFKPAGLGVCSTALIFTDDNTSDGWDKAENVFANVDEQQAMAMVESFKKQLSGYVR